MKLMCKICYRLFTILLVFFLLFVFQEMGKACESQDVGQEKSTSQPLKVQTKLDAILAANLMPGEIQMNDEGTFINVESGFVRLDPNGETLEAELPFEMTFNDKVNTALETLLDLKTGESGPFLSALNGATKALTQGNDRFLNVNLWGVQGGAVFIGFKERFQVGKSKGANIRLMEVATRLFIAKVGDGEYLVNEVYFRGKLEDLSDAQLKGLWRTRVFGMKITNGTAQLSDDSAMQETMKECFNKFLDLAKSKRKDLIFVSFESDGKCVAFYKTQ